MNRSVTGFLVAACAFGAGSLGAQGRPLASLPAMPEAEEIRLAESAAPAEISAGATILVRGATGLKPARKGRNGYVCFVEWFARATTMWPVCYEPELARVMVPINEVLEAYRATGRSEEAFNTTRDSILAAAATVRPGGLSYRLSPAMWTTSPSRKGPWMFLVTAPHPRREQLGLPPSAPPSAPGSVRFGIAGKGASGYFWIDVQVGADSVVGGSAAARPQP